MKKIKLIIPMILTVVALSSIPVFATEIEISLCSVDNTTEISPLAETVE